MLPAASARLSVTAIAVGPVSAPRSGKRFDARGRSKYRRDGALIAGGLHVPRRLGDEAHLGRHAVGRVENSVRRVAEKVRGVLADGDVDAAAHEIALGDPACVSALRLDPLVEGLGEWNAEELAVERQRRLAVDSELHAPRPPPVEDAIRVDVLNEELREGDRVDGRGGGRVPGRLRGGMGEAAETDVEEGRKRGIVQRLRPCGERSGDGCPKRRGAPHGGRRGDVRDEETIAVTEGSREGLRPGVLRMTTSGVRCGLVIRERGDQVHGQGEGRTRGVVRIERAENEVRGDLDGRTRHGRVRRVQVREV